MNKFFFQVTDSSGKSNLFQQSQMAKEVFDYHGTKAMEVIRKHRDKPSSHNRVMSVKHTRFNTQVKAIEIEIILY